MDTRENKYKQIISGIPIKKDFKETIGLFVVHYGEEEYKAKIAKEKWRRIRDIILIILSSLIILGAALILIFSESYPATPAGVVGKYLLAIEKRDAEMAGRFVIDGHDVNQDMTDFQSVKKIISYTEFTNTFEPVIRINLKLEAMKELDSETFWFKEAVMNASFWLVKINGRWYITRSSYQYESDQ